MLISPLTATNSRPQQHIQQSYQRNNQLLSGSGDAPLDSPSKSTIIYIKEIYCKLAVSSLALVHGDSICMLIFATTEFEPSEGGNNQPRPGYT